MCAAAVSLFLPLLLLLALVDAQLAPWQHTALMNVFSQIGCASCPKFAANESCAPHPTLSCDGQDVTAISLRELSLAGTLSEEIGELTGLTSLIIQGTGLSGTLPRALSELVRLTALFLDRNELAETVPDLGLVSGLEVLWLQRNRLTGTLSSSLSRLPRLQGIDVQDNFLVGPLPLFTHEGLVWCASRFGCDAF